MFTEQALYLLSHTSSPKIILMNEVTKDFFGHLTNHFDLNIAKC
jgi:hypothetical protein